MSYRPYSAGSSSASLVSLLTRTGYLIAEQGVSYLTQAESDRALTPLHAAACTYRIAAQGHTQGKKY